MTSVGVVTPASSRPRVRPDWSATACAAFALEHWRLLSGAAAGGHFDPDEFAALERSIRMHTGNDDELLDRLLGPLLEATRQRIVRGQESGQIDAAVDPGIVVELLFGPMFHRWLLRTAPLDDAYAEALAEHVHRAVRPVTGQGR